ncbi:hypothetical protein H6G21_09620 [Alkalinema sp. FACHB-956]|nr:hypothetical protein [Alkalinema sp. FACHB-956]
MRNSENSGQSHHGKRLRNIRNNITGEINRLPKYNHSSAARCAASGEVVATRSEGQLFDYGNDLQEAYRAYLRSMTRTLTLPSLQRNSR